jgi:hypothetical protein
MGYNTEFDGAFTVTPALKEEHREYLARFAESPRVRRDETLAGKLYDPTRKLAGLPVGRDGAYVVAGDWNSVGRDRSIRDQSNPPAGQPSVSCQWTPSEDGATLAWSGEEKFYEYTRWLDYLIEHFLKPWGYSLDGEVRWRGEDFDDMGTIVATRNKIQTRGR